MSKTWKEIERKVARFLGGERVPITGRIRGSAPDIEHDVLSIEGKHRERLPFWLKDAMNQAEASKVGDQLPVVILHEKRMSIDNCVVMIRLRDLKESIYGRGGHTRTDSQGDQIGGSPRLDDSVPEIG